MLKNRQEGILNLHGLWSAALLLFIFLVLKQVFVLLGEELPLDRFNFYMIGVCIGGIANVRILKNYSNHFIKMGWRKAFHLTYQQILRVALVILAIVFLFKDYDTGRTFIGTYLATSFVCLLLMNKTLPKRLCRLSFKTQVIRTMIIGSEESLESLQDWISNKADFGVDIVGYAGENQCPAVDRSVIPCLGTVDDLESIVNEHDINQVVVVQNALSRGVAPDVMKKAQSLGCRVRIYNNWQEEFTQRIVVEHDGGYTFLTYEDEPLENPINRSLKRTFDVAISLPIVAFVLPVLTLAVWFFQRKQSPGPIFYAQPRTGMTKRTFHIIKYRTMHASDENSKNVAKQATKGDSRIYPFGAILRKTSLDELPQFINVLLGEMSVSGPRPHLIDHDKEFSSKMRVYSTRHFVKPGITGLAQCMGFRGEINEPEQLKRRIAYDIEYINTWSIGLDLKIVFRTAKAVVFPPKTAY